MFSENRKTPKSKYKNKNKYPELEKLTSISVIIVGGT